ncbi:A-kinase anchor protein 9, putative isoform 4 [Hibiscus syriacus]|uniref:A-kinase anchor protein 9, putative isoform 4 n=1 Tax=Hibiscus syriacus TaxID=106335 RepID=A0A6A3CMX4_HIBSY|nr:A-kinase anchor protein 9, putative isoform 4 [Hibiscus syriacus]
MVGSFRACMGAGLDKFKNNMESIRNTMLMHEDVFKHQVRELHRLYSVQKILMDELKKEIKNGPSGEEADTVVVAAEDHQAGPSSRTNQVMSIEGSDEDSEVELTLSIGIGGSCSSKKKLKNSSTSSQSVHNKITRELDSSASSSGPGTPVSSSRTTFDQEKKLPHWLFQGFSINRT